MKKLAALFSSPSKKSWIGRGPILLILVSFNLLNVFTISHFHSSALGEQVKILQLSPTK